MYLIYSYLWIIEITGFFMTGGPVTSRKPSCVVEAPLRWQEAFQPLEGF